MKRDYPKKFSDSLRKKSYAGGGPVQDDFLFKSYTPGAQNRSLGEANYQLRQMLDQGHSTYDRDEPSRVMPKSSDDDKKRVSDTLTKLPVSSSSERVDDPNYAGYARGGPVKKRKK